jgi:hypothetical protein
LSDATKSVVIGPADTVSESKSAMSKRQLIDDIRQYNTTASADFLSQFDEAALKQYLEHLQGAQQRLTRIATWTKKNPKLRMVS